MDKKHGFSQKFVDALAKFDTKLNASTKARNLDESYGLSRTATSGLQQLYSYYDKASETPTGRKLRDFYKSTEKQVKDIHEEAQKLKEHKKQLEQEKAKEGPEKEAKKKEAEIANQASANASLSCAP